MKTILTMIFFLVCLKNQAQISTEANDQKAHRRYWYYRTRMVNDFMKLGMQQGDCIVFAERNDGYDGANQASKSIVGPDQIDITNMYMMTLALEYKMLTRNNQDVSSTIKELYYLLHTFNRLDLEAEQFFDSNPPLFSSSTYLPLL